MGGDEQAGRRAHVSPHLASLPLSGRPRLAEISSDKEGLVTQAGSDARPHRALCGLSVFPAPGLARSSVEHRPPEDWPVGSLGAVGSLRAPRLVALE